MFDNILRRCTEVQNDPEQLYDVLRSWLHTRCNTADKNFYSGPLMDLWSEATHIDNNLPQNILNTACCSDLLHPLRAARQLFHHIKADNEPQKVALFLTDIVRAACTPISSNPRVFSNSEILKNCALIIFTEANLVREADGPSRDILNEMGRQTFTPAETDLLFAAALCMQPERLPQWTAHYPIKPAQIYQALIHTSNSLERAAIENAQWARYIGFKDFVECTLLLRDWHNLNGVFPKNTYLVANIMDKKHATQLTNLVKLYGHEDICEEYMPYFERYKISDKGANPQLPKDVQEAVAAWIERSALNHVLRTNAEENQPRVLKKM